MCDLSLHNIKQIDYSMLPCVRSVIDHRRRQKVVRTSATHSPNGSSPTFLFLPHYDVICDLLLNGRTATWNLFLKMLIHEFHELELRIEMNAYDPRSFSFVLANYFTKRSENETRRNFSKTQTETNPVREGTANELCQKEFHS